jgi:hypothetical protein
MLTVCSASERDECLLTTTLRQRRYAYVSIVGHVNTKLCLKLAEGGHDQEE